MNPSEFTLQHSDVVQPKLLNGDCATRDWPLPPAKPWAPAPRPPTVKEMFALMAQSIERQNQRLREKIRGSKL